MALCPGAQSGHTNVVTDAFADRRLSGVSMNAKDSRCRPVTGHRRRERQTPTDAGLHEGKCN